MLCLGRFLTLLKQNSRLLRQVSQMPPKKRCKFVLQCSPPTASNRQDLVHQQKEHILFPQAFQVLGL